MEDNMAKENIAVRSHRQETEWLRKLGKGNLSKGVESLIKRDADGYARRNERDTHPKSRK